jgi:hypothetical protein
MYIFCTSRTDRYSHHLSKFTLPSGAISVQNAHHFTEITPLTENSTPIYGGLQEAHHHIEGVEINSLNFESAGWGFDSLRVRTICGGIAVGDRHIFR